jgi:hypothetical protein
MFFATSEKQNRIEKNKKQIQRHPNAELDIVVLELCYFFCCNSGQFETMINVVSDLYNLILILLGTAT